VVSGSMDDSEKVGLRPHAVCGTPGPRGVLSSHRQHPAPGSSPLGHARTRRLQLTLVFRGVRVISIQHGRQARALAPHRGHLPGTDIRRSSSPSTTVGRECLGVEWLSAATLQQPRSATALLKAVSVSASSWGGRGTLVRVDGSGSGVWTT
jgi:hypothetical protein